MFKTRLILCVLLLFFMCLGACKKIPLEQDPAEQVKAKAVVEKYIQAFADGNETLVREMSQTPFWADGDYFENKEQLMAAFSEQIKQRQPTPFTVQSMKLIPFEEFKTLMPTFAQELIEQKFPQDSYVMLMTLAMNGEQDNGIILLTYQDGLWQVMGIGD